MFRSKALQLVRRLSSGNQFGETLTRKGERCVNQVTLLGRVGQAPVVRGERSNLVTFTLATNEYFKAAPQDDEESPSGWKQVTSWHNVTVFRPGLRDVVSNYCKKGDRVMITGRLAYRKYEDENEKTITVANVVADDIIFLSAQQQAQEEDGGFIDKGYKE